MFDLTPARVLLLTAIAGPVIWFILSPGCLSSEELPEELNDLLTQADMEPENPLTPEDPEDVKPDSLQTSRIVEPADLAIQDAATQNEQVGEAFARSDMVVLGTVAGVRNYLAVDGGYGYDIEVSETLKGSAIDRLSVRAASWLYVIRFNRGEEALLFLKKSDIFLPTDRFILALDSSNRPLAFRVEGDQITGVEAGVREAWEGYTLQIIREFSQ